VSSEMAQLDALEGVSSTRPKRVKSLGLDDQGRAQYLYEVEFVARRFVEVVLAQIQAQSTLKKKFASGELTSAEAVFYVDAINKYSGGRSAQKLIQFEVRLSNEEGVRP
jgi:hypothetical protein